MAKRPDGHFRRLLRRWPLPALCAWAGGWALMILVSWLAWPAWAALVLGVLPALWFQTWVLPGWRRWAVLGGLPLLVLATAGFSAVGPWGWLALALFLLAFYPLGAWRDAPVFPTPAQALRNLGEVVRLAPGAAVLDAGSGLGHAMLALKASFPSARVQGVESSRALVLISRCRLRLAERRQRAAADVSRRPGTPDAVRAGCKPSSTRWALGAQVQRGDMWAMSWAGFDLVYLFQRPESMQRAWDKACTEMKEGAWLVSLEFEVPDVAPAHRLACPDGRPLWIYLVGRAPIQVRQHLADNMRTG